LYVGQEYAAYAPDVKSSANITEQNKRPFIFGKNGGKMLRKFGLLNMLLTAKTIGRLDSAVSHPIYDKHYKDFSNIFTR